jgi:flagellar motor switch protein FliG
MQKAESRHAPPPATFRFLLNVDFDKAAKVIAAERAQTIAMVLSRLPSTSAGHILQRLPAALQVEVVRRLVDLEETDPEIIRDVEAALQARFTQDVHSQRRRVAGLHAVAGILQATESGASLQILDNLARRDRTLAENLGPRDIEFNDLATFSSDELSVVFAEAGPELMLPALLGAPPALLDRVLSGIPPAEATRIRRRLDRPGPIRLRDVDDARKQIGKIAGRVRYQLGIRDRGLGISKKAASLPSLARPNP